MSASASLCLGKNGRPVPSQCGRETRTPLRTRWWQWRKDERVRARSRAPEFYTNDFVYSQGTESPPSYLAAVAPSVGGTTNARTRIEAHKDGAPVWSVINERYVCRRPPRQLPSPCVGWLVGGRARFGSPLEVCVSVCARALVVLSYLSLSLFSYPFCTCRALSLSTLTTCNRIWERKTFSRLVSRGVELEVPFSRSS